VLITFDMINTPSVINPHATQPTSLVALFKSLARNCQLIVQMTKREVVGRHKGSALGLAWSFFNPIFMLVVYTFVFSNIFKSRWGGVGGDDSKTQFALVLFVGMIVHSLFSEVLNRAPGLILGTVNYVKNMVFNNSARALLRETEGNTPIVSHDWWAYMVVTGCGGKVFYDCKPTLRYRLHAANLVGANFSWPARLRRLRMLWQGRFRNWNDSNIAALRKLESKLTPENRIILERFAKARQMSLVFRLINLKRSGIHRQTILGNVGLTVAAIFRRL